MNQERQALYEANQYMATVLKLVSLVLILIIMIYSDNPWISTPINLLMPIIGVGSIKLAEKYSNLMYFPFFVNPLILFFLIYYAGVNAPGWMQSFTILTGAFFIMPKRVHHFVLFIYVLTTVSLANLLIGQTLNASVTIFTAVFVVGVLLERSFNYLILQQKKINDQKQIIENKQEEITDSIKYAKRLQNAILPSFDVVNKHLPNNFILFKPKDVVSGDFYWFEQLNGIYYLAAADCTGHGVPGAMVSVVCSNALNRSLNEFGITEPSKILDKTRELVIETFAKSGEDVKDGMDIALCAFNGNKVIYSGANNPLWIVRKTELLTQEQKEERNCIIENGLSLIEHKPNKQPIGLYDWMKEFTQEEIELQSGDSLYIFTDGFADQFGGEKGKKFMYKPFKRLLIDVHTKPIYEQAQLISDSFENWRGELEQIDDVCVIGVKIE
jgi:serine phosphatase RsbU (regulator of sigma subunit)